VDQNTGPNAALFYHKEQGIFQIFCNQNGFQSNANHSNHTHTHWKILKKNYENCNKHILLKNIPVLMADKFCPQSLKDVPRHFPVKGAKNTQNI